MLQSIFFRPTKMSISKPKRGVPNLPATKFRLYDLVWALNIRGIFSSQIKKPNLLMLLWTQKLVDLSLRFLEDNLLKLWIMTYDILVTPTYHTFRNLPENQRQILCFKLVVLYSKCWIVPSPPPGPPLYLAWGEYVMSTHELLEKEMQTLSHQNSCPTILKSRHGVFQEKPQYISFVWYAGDGGPGHEEGRPSALLNIGHQSQTWLWYFQTFWCFNTLILWTFWANPVKLWKILHCPPSKGCRSKQKENTG